MRMKYIISLIVLIMMTILPCRLNAQFGRSDGFFSGYNDDIYSGTRDAYNINVFGQNDISNQTFGQELPLGNGLIVMIAAGAGYAIIKRRKNNAKN